MQDALSNMSLEQREQLLDRLMQQLADDGYMTEGDPQGQGKGQGDGQTRFEITDKSVDFLGFKTLKDLLGSLGKSSFGAHDTRDLSTGVETRGSSKVYECGDTLNLDVSTTLFSAIQRSGLKTPLDIDYPDLHVHQSDYQ